MLFDITDEQEFFRSTTGKFLAARVPRDRIRRLRHDDTGFPADYWQGGAELGWTSFLVAEKDGGGSISGRPVVDLTLIAYEFGRHAAPGPLVPDSDRIGAVDGGWTVGTRWMHHERLLSESPYVTVPERSAISDRSPVEIACRAGTADEPGVRDLIGEAQMLEVAGNALQRRLGTGMVSGRISDQSAAIGRLFRGIAESRRATVEFEIAAAGGAVWTEDLGDCADVFLMRQVSCIGGGTTEMARNVISERVLGMPREARSDHAVPFREVPRGGRRGS